MAAGNGSGREGGKSTDRCPGLACATCPSGQTRCAGPSVAQTHRVPLRKTYGGCLINKTYPGGSGARDQGCPQRSLPWLHFAFPPSSKKGVGLQARRFLGWLILISKELTGRLLASPSIHSTPSLKMKKRETEKQI